jgi:hypothetical protein
MAPADLSAVKWVFSLNSMPGALLSRLDVYTVGLPGLEHVDELFAGLLQSLAAELGLRAEDVPVLPDRVSELLQRPL